MGWVPNNQIWLDTRSSTDQIWRDTCSSTDNTLQRNGRTVENSSIPLKNEKEPETSGDLTCHVFALEDAVAHIRVTDLTGILTIEKRGF